MGPVEFLLFIGIAIFLAFVLIRPKTDSSSLDLVWTIVKRFALVIVLVFIGGLILQTIDSAVVSSASAATRTCSTENEQWIRTLPSDEQVFVRNNIECRWWGPYKNPNASSNEVEVPTQDIDSSVYQGKTRRCKVAKNWTRARSFSWIHSTIAWTIIRMEFCYGHRVFAQKVWYDEDSPAPYWHKENAGHYSHYVWWNDRRYGSYKAYYRVAFEFTPLGWPVDHETLTQVLKCKASGKCARREWP